MAVGLARIKAATLTEVTYAVAARTTMLCQYLALTFLFPLLPLQTRADILTGWGKGDAVKVECKRLRAQTPMTRF